jgi:hypothetical protein
MANCRPNSRRDFFFLSRPLRVYWLLLLLWYKRRDRDSKRCNNILLSWSRLSRPANRKRKNLFPSPFFYPSKKKETKVSFFFMCFAYLLFSSVLLPSCGCCGVSDPSSIFRLVGDNDQVSDFPLPSTHSDSI